MFRQEIDSDEAALLQSLFRIKIVAQQPRVALGDFALPRFGAGGAGAQAG